MKSLQIFSSGGVGDSLIVGLKIEQATQNTPQEIIWKHFEKHECHQSPCLEIQKQFVPRAECFIKNQPEKCAKKLCEEVNGKYITTVASNIFYPYLKRQINGQGFFHEKLLGLKNYIVVQAQAGRMYDGTRREVNINVINQLLSLFPNKHLVILGPEEHSFHTSDINRTINLTGQTNSILDALFIINSCCLFVGQDGVMAYYSLMLRKKVIIGFHIPTLPQHYWNDKWNNHSLAFVGAGNIIQQLPNSEKLRNFLAEIK